MSDEAVAAVEPTPEAAPEQSAATSEKAPPKVRTIDDDFEDVLKKHGGYKYKAGGKEKTVTSSAEIKRLFSYVDGVNGAADEALKNKKEAEGIKSRLASLKQMKPLERVKALAELVGDDKILREGFEETFLSEDAKAREDANLSQREREYRTQLEQRDGELAEYRQAKENWEKQQKEAEYVARVTEVGKRLESVTVGALTKAKIAGEHAPRFLEAIGTALDRNERLGLGLDEGEIADVVMKEHGSLARTFYDSMGVADHADELEQMEMPDPSDPNKKTTRAKLLMREYARRIKARQNGTAIPMRAVQNGTRPPQKKEMSDSEKLDASRTFGGGNW